MTDSKVTASKKSKIYSQASNDFVLAVYEKKEKGTQSPHVIQKAIIIKGGANVAYSASNKMQRNTKWAVTEVTAEELELLKAHKGFIRRVKKGFISIDKEPEVLKADKSAQMTKKQAKIKTKAEVKTGPVDE